LKIDHICSLLETVSLSDENRFHLLRHFDSVPEHYSMEIANRLGRPPADIRNQLFYSGSKFSTSFAAHPDMLWQRLSTDISKTALHTPSDDAEPRTLFTPRSDSDYVFHLHYSPIPYAGGIGSDGVVALNDLKTTDRNKVTMKMRGKEDKIEVPTVYLSRLPATWKVQVVLRKTEQALIVLTIFPGTYAPPLPEPAAQTAKDLQASIEFWKTHALVQSVSLSES